MLFFFYIFTYFFQIKLESSQKKPQYKEKYVDYLGKDIKKYNSIYILVDGESYEININELLGFVKNDCIKSKWLNIFTSEGALSLEVFINLCKANIDDLFDSYLDQFLIGEYYFKKSIEQLDKEDVFLLLKANLTPNCVDKPKDKELFLELINKLSLNDILSMTRNDYLSAFIFTYYNTNPNEHISLNHLLLLSKNDIEPLFFNEGNVGWAKNDLEVCLLKIVDEFSIDLIIQLPSFINDGLLKILFLFYYKLKKERKNDHSVEKLALTWKGGLGENINIKKIEDDGENINIKKIEDDGENINIKKIEDDLVDGTAILKLMEDSDSQFVFWNFFCSLNRYNLAKKIIGKEERCNNAVDIARIVKTKLMKKKEAEISVEDFSEKSFWLNLLYLTNLNVDGYEQKIFECETDLDILSLLYIYLKSGLLRTHNNNFIYFGNIKGSEENLSDRERVECMEVVLENIAIQEKKKFVDREGSKVWAKNMHCFMKKFNALRKNHRDKLINFVIEVFKNKGKKIIEHKTGERSISERSVEVNPAYKYWIEDKRKKKVANYKFKWEKYATSVCVLCGVALTGMAYYAPSKLPSWFSQRKAYAFGIGSIGLSLAAGGYRYLNKDNKDYMEESI